MIRIFLIVLSLFPLATEARVYKCETANGIVYQEHPCSAGGGSLPIDLGGYSQGGGGLREGERQLLNEFKYKNQEMKRAQHRSSKQHLGYSDRLRLRELRMRRGELDEKLNKRGLSAGGGIAIREQIRSIDREIEQIYNRRQ